MNSKEQHLLDRWDPEPRWPAFIAILAVGGLDAALPSYLIIGPHWLFPAIVLMLLVPTVISHGTGHHGINRFFGFTVSVVITIGMFASVVLLIRALPGHQATPTELGSSAIPCQLDVRDERSVEACQQGTMCDGSFHGGYLKTIIHVYTHT